MIILGIVLVIIGALLNIGLLYALGGILLVIGVILWILGAVGRPVAGRRYSTDRTRIREAATVAVRRRVSVCHHFCFHAKQKSGDESW